MQMSKEEVLRLLTTMDRLDAGAVISFVSRVPPEDDRFQQCWGKPKFVLEFRLEEKKKFEGKFLHRYLSVAAGRAGAGRWIRWL